MVVLVLVMLAGVVLLVLFAMITWVGDPERHLRHLWASTPEVVARAGR